ncbi:extracellular serine-rich protein [Teratosphaeria destructans]|uniref:Extracellular serine-rich protein n=1 Tax=Teratosphaeria destructans TaxID=418781 RepID=A0A9W7SM40_9PEZI|nr:extracellular serine-rich protein [Teratosphaeria destructans]
MFLIHASLILGASIVLAQETGANNSSAPTTTDGEITIHTVTVGKVLNEFQPNSINAVPGDIVSFEFWSGNHSVIGAAYGYPCIPVQDVVDDEPGFFSAFQPNATDSDHPVWNLTINDTSPVFYYCGAPGSCIGYGMVGVINPNSSTSIITQISLAKEADYMIEPGQALPEAISTSIASLAATATTATVTLTPSAASSTTAIATSSTSAAPSAKKSSSGLSSGAIAGIAVGSAVVAIGAALLFFFLGRHKSLKEEVDHHRAAASQANQGEKGPSMSLAAAQSRHNMAEVESTHAAQSVVSYDGRRSLSPPAMYGPSQPQASPTNGYHPRPGRVNRPSWTNSEHRQSGFTEIMGQSAQSNQYHLSTPIVHEIGGPQSPEAGRREL